MDEDAPRGPVVRRVIEAGSRLVWVPAVAFLIFCVAGGIPGAYEWDRPGASADAVIARKLPYLNPLFFTIRGVIYWAIFGALAWAMNKWGEEQGERGEAAGKFDALNNWAARGILIHVIITTLAWVDWVMSVEPKWVSSIIGLLAVAMQGITGLSLALILLRVIAADQPITADHSTAPGGLGRYFRDIGNLLLVTVMLWAYMSFSQYMLQYSGNLTEEIAWYVRRGAGGWGAVALTLIPFHFFIPWLTLLIGSNIKKDPKKLCWVAGWLLVARFADITWWIAPTSQPTLGDWLAPASLASALGCWLFIGGVWLMAWVVQIRDRTVVPAHDPRLTAHLHEVTAHG